MLTDGTCVWGPDGEEYKKFSFADVMGISLGIRAGLVFALISGEESPFIDRFAGKMGITDVHKKCRDKAAALKTFAGKYHFDMSEICFMGDDVNDLPAMELAGLASAPATAHKSARDRAALVTKCGGGQGAVRELLDMILGAKSGGSQ